MRDSAVPRRRRRPAGPRRFSCHEHVRWSDVDAAGLIRWSAYTRLMELAETEFFRALGFTYQRVFDELGIWLPRAQAHLNFLRPLLLDDRVRILVHVGRLSRSSIRYEYQFETPDGSLAAEAHLVVVSTTPGRPPRAVSLPEALRAALLPYCADPGR